jgi:hypothetical protein
MPDRSGRQSSFALVWTLPTSPLPMWPRRTPQRPIRHYYVYGTDTYQSVADNLTASVAACYVPDRLNVYRIRQMVSPAGTPIASFKRLDLEQVQGLTNPSLRCIGITTIMR